MIIDFSNEGNFKKFVLYQYSIFVKTISIYKCLKKKLRIFLNLELPQKFQFFSLISRQSLDFFPDPKLFFSFTFFVELFSLFLIQYHF